MPGKVGKKQVLQGATPSGVCSMKGLKSHRGSSDVAGAMQISSTKSRMPIFCWMACAAGGLKRPLNVPLTVHPALHSIP